MGWEDRNESNPGCRLRERVLPSRSMALRMRGLGRAPSLVAKRGPQPREPLSPHLQNEMRKPCPELCNCEMMFRYCVYCLKGEVEHKQQVVSAGKKLVNSMR